MCEGMCSSATWLPRTFTYMESLAEILKDCSTGKAAVSFNPCVDHSFRKPFMKEYGHSNYGLSYALN